jgi:hypothetical protein
VLHEEMNKAQKKWNDKMGLKKPKQEDDDNISRDGIEEEGFTETKDNSGKATLPFTVTQEEDQLARSHRCLATRHLLDERTSTESSWLKVRDLAAC